MVARNQVNKHTKVRGFVSSVFVTGEADRASIHYTRYPKP